MCYFFYKIGMISRFIRNIFEDANEVIVTNKHDYRCF